APIWRFTHRGFIHGPGVQCRTAPAATANALPAGNVSELGGEAAEAATKTGFPAERRSGCRSGRRGGRGTLAVVGVKGIGAAGPDRIPFRRPCLLGGAETGGCLRQGGI